MTILVQQQLRDLLGKLTTAFWRNDGLLVCPAYRDGETVYVQSWRPVAEAASTDYARFIAAANPAVVLALLDELDAANANHENAVAHMQSVCAERDRLNALLIERETIRMGHSLQRHDDQKQIDELVAMGIQQDKDEIERLNRENERWRQNYEHLIEQHMPRTGHGCEEGWSRVVEARELSANNAELLDALKDALCALECSPVQYDHVMGKARRAIAKAMGEN